MTAAQADLFSSVTPRPAALHREAAYQVTSPTSRAAARAARPKAGSQRARVLAYLTAKPSTMHAVAEALRIPLSSVCGRIAELKERNQVVDSGQRRETPFGAMAAVWRVIQW